MLLGHVIRLVVVAFVAVVVALLVSRGALVCYLWAVGSSAWLQADAGRRSMQCTRQSINVPADKLCCRTGRYMSLVCFKGLSGGPAVRLHTTAFMSHKTTCTQGSSSAALLCFTQQQHMISTAHCGYL